jgi:phosphoribosylformimino-5-aminoimidazole carboxamide ribotide isomerase
MIEIIPAIDIIEGKCVRLTKGSYETKKSYYDDPLEVAHKFEAAGLRRVHLVDLDGAKEGRVINYNLIEKLASKTGLKIDFGGGIRTDKDLEIVFECGAVQATAGSVAVTKKEMVFNWFSKFGPEAIILGADVKFDKIAIHGWQEESELYTNDFLNEYKEHGAKYVICTDIEKDGMLNGPGFELYKRINGEIEGLSLIASGGVSSISDIEKLQSQGLYGVIVGKAIYEGRINLTDLKIFLC